MKGRSNSLSSNFVWTFQIKKVIFFFFFRVGILQKMQRRDHQHGGGVGHHRTMSAVTQKLQLTDYYYLGGLDSLSTASLMEVPTTKNAKLFINLTPSWVIFNLFFFTFLF